MKIGGCYFSSKQNTKSIFTPEVSEIPNILQEKYDIPLLHRNQIQISRLLGKGDFAKVYEGIGRVCEKRKSHQNAITLQRESQHDPIHLRQPANKFHRPISLCNARQRYAFKFLRKSTLRTGEDHALSAATDLISEAAFLALLDHENIVKLHGLSSLDGQLKDLFLMIDRLQYTLDKKMLQWKKEEMQNPPITQAKSCNATILVQKCEIALQIASALQYTHDCGLIYRDLKPQNIGFQCKNSSEESCTVKLFDFGLCRELPVEAGGDNYDKQEESFHMSIAGTRRYMAPEMIRTSRYNNKADVYSWAILFYEMLSLMTPYSEYDKYLHEKNVCEGGDRPSLFDLDIPKYLTHILLEAWHQEVSERLTMRLASEKLHRALHTMVSVKSMQQVNSSGNSDYIERGLVRFNSGATVLCSLDE